MKLRERITKFFESPIVPKLRELIHQAEEFGLPEIDTSNAREMLKVNEGGEAFDIVVTQLYEYEIPVTAQFVELSEEIMNEMKIDRSEFEFLYKLPIRMPSE